MHGLKVAYLTAALTARWLMCPDTPPSSKVMIYTVMYVSLIHRRCKDQTDAKQTRKKKEGQKQEAEY